MSLDDAKVAFVGKTRNVKAYQFGSQVSYMAPDGSVYLWFPGNPVVLQGKWSFKESGGFRPYAGKPVSETSLCFDYGPNTVNAWSRRRSGTECIPSDTAVLTTVESESGDVFGLAGRTEVPFVLPREKTTLADLRKRVGLRS
ncbi:hypothetical protein [Methylobacterium sp. 77]|uniref:hypothetical protein n=1 Tax=Methylobacterium sp. 77 TaxID=1101192 RepID=UPI0012DE8DF1|nr:hypothetical protein [Methylobacterium sp. 77]